MDVIKIGDVVTYNTRWSNPFITIIRETKTMFIGDRGVRIYKKDNRIVGESYCFARLITQEDLDAQKKCRLARELREFDFDKLELNVLEEIKLLIDKKEKL